MNSFITLFCLCAVLSAVSAEVMLGTNYCNITCKNPVTQRVVKHIACGDTGTFDSRKCYNAKAVDMTKELETLILDFHNTKRNLVAGGKFPRLPSACRMATMKYNPDLAKFAAIKVKQCTDDHDGCHNTHVFKVSGQNLYYKGKYPGNFDNKETFTGGMESWYKELNDVNEDIIDNFPENRPRGAPVIGHATIMINDHNTHVGCAAATYVNGRYTIYLIACNYATTNWRTKPVYDKCPTPGKLCTTGRNPLYPNLCSENEPYDVNRWYTEDEESKEDDEYDEYDTTERQ